MVRRKSKAIEPIGTREEAAALANDYAKLTADIAAIEAERLKAKAAIDADCDERIGNRADSHAALFERLKLWWLGGGADLVASKKRSANFGGVKIGLRTPMPSLKWAKGLKLDDVIASLVNAKWSRASMFLRRKVTLDKEAIIKAMIGNDMNRHNLTLIGFEVSQTEDFFIDITSKEVAPGTSGTAGGSDAPAAPIVRPSTRSRPQDIRDNRA